LVWHQCFYLISSHRSGVDICIRTVVVFRIFSGGGEGPLM
jgi:hypothetical protein